MVIFLLSTLLHTQSLELDTLRWEKRPLLIFAASKGRMAEITAIATAHKASLDERDVQLVAIAPGESIELRERFDIPAAQTTVVLIGKDGGEKARWRDRLPLPELEQTIDAMPMRRREMRLDNGRG